MDEASTNLASFVPATGFWGDDTCAVLAALRPAQLHGKRDIQALARAMRTESHRVGGDCIVLFETHDPAISQDQRGPRRIDESPIRELLIKEALKASAGQILYWLSMMHLDRPHILGIASGAWCAHRNRAAMNRAQDNWDTIAAAAAANGH